MLTFSLRYKTIEIYDFTEFCFFRTKSSVSQHFNGVIIPAMGSRDADEGKVL